MYQFRAVAVHSIPDNRPFPSSHEPLFQNEGRCSAFDMEIIFNFHANKTHFPKKGGAPSLILKVRVFGTRKWPICIGGMPADEREGEPWPFSHWIVTLGLVGYTWFSHNKCTVNSILGTDGSSFILTGSINILLVKL